METRQDRHVEQFYEWEQRGRGWLLANSPVELEAPFHPFIAHRVPLPYTDDGKRETIFSNFRNWIKKPHTVPDLPSLELPAIEPYGYDTHTGRRVIGISFQRGVNVKIERMEQLFVMLTQCA